MNTIFLTQEMMSRVKKSLFFTSWIRLSSRVITLLFIIVLFFNSNRPDKEGGKTVKGRRLWHLKKGKKGWSKPVLFNPIPGVKISALSFAGNGNMYFISQVKGSSFDIFLAKKIDSGYKKPERLSNNVNSKQIDFLSFVDPDEKYIVLWSMGRPDSSKHSELYISFREKKGNWGKAVSIGKEINSGIYSRFAQLSPDNKYIFFTGKKSPYRINPDEKLNLNRIMDINNSPYNGDENVYWISVEILKTIKR